MNGFEYILTKQISWADRNNVKLIGSKITKGRLAYTEKLDKNLFEPLLPETRSEIEKGDGGELKGDYLRKTRRLTKKLKYDKIHLC